MSWSQLRKTLDRIGLETNEWAGLPCPVEEARLVVAPKYPRYEQLNGCTLKEESQKVQAEDLLYEEVNSWYNQEWKCYVSLFRNKLTGQVIHGMIPADTHGKKVAARLKMLGIGLTMDIESERKALSTLRALIKPHMADAYEMLGWFIETSKVSGVTYLFRKLAPTVAFRINEDSSYQYLAALCLHPIAYYDGLPMGSMVPTDDVIAHLVMMRADEHMFWRKANQHGPLSPGANL